ncbi:Class II glutamine amidotransferase domain [Macleaya cordata]|uniref:Class II glutamine amidotransferase domain n=1 Tax=Macleaya cordata TaxID=56857 RepID=A0A200PRG5_MACCD|nr:Class II glutamine amidotransferase domain [Macleaya cordata]
MCGIALIISGVRIDLSSLIPDFVSVVDEAEQVHHPKFSVEDLEAVLQRRGPDHLGSKKVFLQLKTSSYFEKENNESFLNVEEVTESVKSHFLFPQTKTDCISSANEVTQDNGFIAVNSVAELHFLGSVLQLRGITPVYQPLVDASGNILVYNGEIFAGLHLDRDSNDAETLLHALGRCCSCNCDGHRRACYCIEKEGSSVLELLSTIKGPWALVYWQESSKTLWFGRDAFGRRSLLVHWPNLDDSRLMLSSVSPPSYAKKSSDSEVGDPENNLDFWEELSCGIYSICFNASELEECLVGEVKKHEWADPVLKELIRWERINVDPKSAGLCSNSVLVEREPHIMDSTYSQRTPSGLEQQGFHIIQQNKPYANDSASLVNNVILSGSNMTCKGLIQPSVSLPTQKVLIALRESVMRRTTLHTIFPKTKHEAGIENLVPVAVLFSGGLDSMILAALLDECLNPSYEIDLLNVSFDGQSAPDRISAKAGVKELQRIAPSRRWNLVEIDHDLSNLTSETKHVMSLINPSKTYMDLNIGIALWLAAGGDGWLDKGILNDHINDHQRVKYKSEAKILLVGSGADEQCAGYSRHKTKYRLGGWLGLHEEMKLDMQRIWKRNLGRDDRCISDKGKEARFPFLDEDVIRTLLEIPLWEVADLNQPTGRGDKKILREVAQLLGLEAAAFLPKRAIQFGSRIARESNRKNFGSNRAANQASAGSVVIHKPTNIT